MLVFVVLASMPGCAAHRLEPQPGEQAAARGAAGSALVDVAANTPAPPNQESRAKDAPDAGLEEPAPAPTAAPEPTLELVEETPYKRYERPIPAGSVYAAGLEEELARWNVGGRSDPGFISNRTGFHPGTRVVVDTVTRPGQLPHVMRVDRRTGKPRRGLSEQTLLAQARKNGYWPYRLCFEDGARQLASEKGSKLKGSAHIRVRIAPSGRVVGARLLANELDRDVADCLLGRTQKLAFAPGPPHALDALFMISLWPGDAPLPERMRPVSSTTAKPEAPSKLNGSTVSATMANSHEQLRQCFAAGMARDPLLWGRLELRIDLSSDGHVQKAVEHQSRFPDPQVVECVRQVVENTSFPGACDAPTSMIYAWRLGHLPAPPEPVLDEDRRSPTSAPPPQNSRAEK